MEGWAELFKHFLASKLSSACLLIASITLCFGHDYAVWIPDVPEGWRWLAFGIMVFTGCQCLWWSISVAGRLVRRTASAAWKAIFPVRIQKLSKYEKYLLGFTSAAGGFLNLRRLEEHRQFETDSNAPDPIAAKVAASNLYKWGLLDYTIMGDLYLTDMGSRFVLKHQEPVKP